MAMNFQKGSGLEIKAFTGLKSEKPKNTEMRCWTPLELVFKLTVETPIQIQEIFFFHS